MKAVYFAWVRERVGVKDEILAPPASVETIAELLQWLASRGENYAHAFESAELIRVALDHVHAKHTMKIANVQEIAFFPPMTGG